MRKIIAVILAIISVLSFSACGSEVEETTIETVATNVEAATAIVRDVSHTATYTGELKAKETASVTCMVSAKITGILADVGDYVTKGEVLLSLDTQQLSLQYEQALAGYNQALAAYNSTTGGSTQQQLLSLEQSLSAAKTNYNTALDNYNREQALFDIGATSQLSLTNAKTALDNAKLSLDTAQKNYDLTVSVVTPEASATAKAAVDSANAAVALAKSNLANAKVCAPISGYVASKSVNIGQMASPGFELFTIKNTDSFEAEINVTESVISKVAVGSEAEVKVGAAGENLLGTVSLVNPTKNGQTGLYTVRVKIENKDLKLKEGMFADITIKTEVQKSAICVPSEAIFEEDGESFAYVINENLAEKRKVVPGTSDEEFTGILSGINEGEQVVVSGKEYISEKNNQVNITRNY